MEACLVLREGCTNVFISHLILNLQQMSIQLEKGCSEVSRREDELKVCLILTIVIDFRNVHL